MEEEPRERGLREELRRHKAESDKIHSDLRDSINKHDLDDQKLHAGMREDIIRLQESDKSAHKESDSRFEMFTELRKNMWWAVALVLAGVVAAVLKLVMK